MYDYEHDRSSFLYRHTYQSNATNKHRNQLNSTNALLAHPTRKVFDVASDHSFDFSINKKNCLANFLTYFQHSIPMYPCFWASIFLAYLSLLSIFQWSYKFYGHMNLNGNNKPMAMMTKPIGKFNRKKQRFFFFLILLCELRGIETKNSQPR